jgi:hypothetical protein
MRTTEQHRDFIPAVRIARVRARIRVGEHLCARQRLHRDTQGRYRRSCEGWRFAGADYGS